MNKIHLIGNLTKDPELTSTSSGLSVCNFSIAVNRKFKSSDGNRPVDYFNCKVWGKLGVTIAKFVKKGNKVSVCGAVAIDSYEDDKGNKRQSVTVSVDEIEFLTPNTSTNEAAINSELHDNGEGSGN